MQRIDSSRTDDQEPETCVSKAANTMRRPQGHKQQDAFKARLVKSDSESMRRKQKRSRSRLTRLTAEKPAETEIHAMHRKRIIGPVATLAIMLLNVLTPQR